MYTWKIWQDRCLIDWTDITFDTEEDALEDAQGTVKFDIERLADDGVEMTEDDYEIEIEEVDEE